ncbi:type II toxin-antitoxin system HigB family toxin [Dyadobacter psychrotolerans]|uniref:Type II toxin-antitoxin system HigB family toxin n=1 Tax=Dyadobacter psychrotolerans TaxID=2541721 RepID=A0A4R5DIF8_9BACT|nr:type II toxin-antitoxin system HigB family toxin [Dyadobacter psychrotolerans]TDE11740.1 type II toxin-antitoxin system HigB family toxin [Dyadobacter psychrotolerans]
MRIIATRNLRAYGEIYPLAKQSLLAWNQEVERANWNSPNELKIHYRNASILNNKRVVFNIHGNSYRLIVDIEFRLKIVFIIWFGTHKEYDQIDAKKIEYGSSNKK